MESGGVQDDVDEDEEDEEDEEEEEEPWMMPLMSLVIHSATQHATLCHIMLPYAMLCHASNERHQRERLQL